MISVENWATQAVAKLKEEKKIVKGQKETAMAGAVMAAIKDFCLQDEEFAQAVVQGGSFADCMKKVAAGVGMSISDLDGVSDIYQLRSIEVQLGKYMLPLMSGYSSISVNYVDATDVGIQYYNYDIHAGYVLRIFMRYIKK